MTHEDLGINPATGKPYITFEAVLPNLYTDPRPNIKATCEICNEYTSCIPIETSNGKRFVWCGSCSAGIKEACIEARTKAFMHLMGFPLRG